MNPVPEENGLEQPGNGSGLPECGIFMCVVYLFTERGMEIVPRKKTNVETE